MNTGNTLSWHFVMVLLLALSLLELRELNSVLRRISQEEPGFWSGTIKQLM